MEEQANRNRDQRPPGRSGCRRLLALGCGVTLALGALLTAASVAYFRPMFQRFDRVVETQHQLVSSKGARDAFAPWRDGLVPADRLDRFLAVRRALAPLCRGFDQTLGPIAELEARGDDVKPSAGEIWGVVRGAFGMGNQLARYLDQRNRSLLANDMGLGEYSYLYFVTYLAGPEASATRQPLRGGSSTAARAAFLAMLRSTLPPLAERDPEDPLAREVAALEHDPERLPWPDGLPAPLAESLASRRVELDALSCPLAVSFEMSQVKRQAFGVQAD